MMSTITYSIADPSKYIEVSDLLLRSFFVEEPLGLGLGLTTDQVSRWLSEHIKSALSHGVSYIATTKNSDDEEKVVGVSVNVIKISDTVPLGIMGYLDKETEPNMWQVARFLSLLNQDLDVSPFISDGIVPDKIMTCLFLNVDKDYAGRGIAKTLAQKSEELAISKNINLFQVDTTSEFSYKIYTKLGYKTVRTIPFDQFTNEDGESIVNPDIVGIHQFGRVLIKDLKPEEFDHFKLQDGNRE